MRKRELIAAAIGALAATVLAGGIAWGAIGDGGLIQGCYDSGGNLKIVAALPCPKGYTQLAWNREGIQGPKGDKGDPGPAGLQGEAGPQGPAGADGQEGVSGFELVEASASIAPGDSGTIVVACPAGKTVLQGRWTKGLQLTATDEFFTFTGPPVVSGSYHVVIEHESGVGRLPITGTASASCMDV